MAQPFNVPDPGTPDGSIAGSGPYCDVQRLVFGPHCTLCHRMGGQAPDLSFDGAKTSISGVESQLYPGHTFVVSGNADTSFLYKKTTGELAPNEGQPMPIGNMLPMEAIDALKKWIDEGASFECDSEPSTDAGVTKYHPDGFNDRNVHGVEMKLGLQDCRGCHGQDLTGGVGPSCDSCHATGWRHTCTFCHGGTDTMTGAPPRDLDNQLSRELLSFAAHTQHTTVRNHRAWDCDQCHAKPTDVLSPNHAFDSTPGRAEVDFSRGLSSAGVYEGNGKCSNLYCHGDGRTTGAYDHALERPTCNGCHPESRLGGQHEDHLEEDLRCNDCHSATVDRAMAIVAPDLHVNGIKDLVLPSSITRNNGTCAGTCHDEEHENERW